MARYEIIVVGLGAIGSAAAHYLARDGVSVLGIDRFKPPHNRGSSHGETRITRVAIGEGLIFSPLALRSHELWRELEQETGETLLVQCGCLQIPNGASMSVHGVEAFFQNLVEGANRYKIPHKMFRSGDEIKSRFPQFRVRDQDVAFFDEWGGYVLPERCISAHLNSASRLGANFQFNTALADFRAKDRAVEIVCDDGSTHQSDHLLIATGAWLPRMIGGAVEQLLTVTRQVLFWFEVEREAESFRANRFPTFIWQAARSPQMSDVYGFPLVGDASTGLKITHEEEGVAIHPDALTQEVSPREVNYTFENYVAPYFPNVGARCVRSEVCMYTRTKNSRFIIDQHPEFPQITFASACSGHGFKHSAAVGEAIAAGLARRGPPKVDLEPFRLTSWFAAERSEGEA